MTGGQTFAATGRHPPHLAAFKLACATAVSQAGGQDFVARETGRSQSRISDYCSLSKPDFMPLDVAMLVDALSLGTTGTTPVADAMARHRAALNGAPVSAQPLSDHAARIARESGELIAAMIERVNERSTSGSMRSLLTREGGELQAAIAAMLSDLARD